MSRVYSNSGVHVNLFRRTPLSQPPPICDGVGAVQDELTFLKQSGGAHLFVNQVN